MDELNNGSQTDVLIALVAAAAGTKQDEYRPHAFASGIDDIMANAFNKRHIRMQLINYKAVNSFEVCRDHCADFFVHGATV